MQYYIKINWELTSNCKANKNNTKVAYIFSSLNNWNQSILIKIIEITMKIGEHEWVQFLKIQTIYSTLKIASRRAKHLHLHMKKVTFLHNMPNLIISLNTVDSWFLEPSLFKYFFKPPNNSKQFAFPKVVEKVRILMYNCYWRMFIPCHLHVGIQKYDIIKVHQGKARAQGDHRDC